MAERTKGITIPIEADVSGVKKAFRDLRSDSREVENQLKDVDRALKLDPTNVDLLNAKQKLLAQAVEKSSEQLEAAKAAQDAFVQSGGDVNSSQYIQMQIETQRLSGHLEQLEQESDNVAAAINGSGDAAETAADNTEEYAEASEKATSSSGAWEVALGNLISNGLDKLISSVTSAISSTITLSDDLATLANNYNLSTEAVYTLYQYQGLLDYSMQSVTKMITEQQKAVAGDAQAYTDLGIQVRDANGQMLSQEQIFVNTLTRLREIEDPIVRTQTGVQLLGNKFYELGGIMTADTADFNAFTASMLKEDAELHKNIDGMNKLNDGMDKLKMVLTDVALGFGSVIGWLFDLKGIGEVVVILIAGITAAWLAFGGAAQLAAAAQAMLNAVMMANPIGLVILAITALIAVFVLLWENCDGFKQFWIDMWDIIVDDVIAVTDALKKAFSAAITWIADAFKALWDWIVGLWNSLVSLFSGGLSTSVSVNGGSGRGYNGSHANGLDYVPFDGYIAQLHKGERVLTAEENAAYGKSGGGFTLVQNIQSVAQSPIELAAASEQYFQMAKWQ